MAGVWAHAIQPEAVSLYLALAMLAVDIWIKDKKFVQFLFLVAAFLLLFSSLLVSPISPFGFSELNLDSFTAAARVLLTLIFFAVSLYLASPSLNFKAEGLFYSLIFFSFSGVLLMIEANNLLTLLVALEISSIASYALASYGKTKREFEATLKYYLSGGFASGLFVIGMAIAGVLAGGLTYSTVGSYLSLPHEVSALFYPAIVLILSAFSYKVAVFPWQVYTPDFYQGQNRSALLFNATVVKSGGLLALISFFRFLPQTDTLSLLFAILIILSWFYANLSALAERSVLRIAAFSSISHATFVLSAILLPFNQMERTSLLYAFVYGISTSAFLASLYSVSNSGDFKLDNLFKLRTSNPLVAFTFVVSILSLAGIPPLPVFFGKYYLLKELVSAGRVGIAVIGGIFSAISLGYYLKMLREAFLGSEEAKDKGTAETSAPVLAISFNILMILFFAFYSGVFFSLLPPA